ncbi:MAG: hypothetical protein GQ581_04920 [Methyloprofundus sp.]|nr:hypothetical protein [Methyloprofundus sp.]
MSIKTASYLYKNRHGVFYFRVVIPKNYRQFFSVKKELKRSLKTENKHIALRLARKLMVDFDKLLADIQSGKTRVSQYISAKDLQLPNGAKIGSISIDHGNKQSEYEALVAILNSGPTDNQQTNNTQASSSPSFTLKEVCDKYFSAKQIKDWSHATYNENKVIFNLFGQLLDTSVIFSSLTRMDLTTAKEKLVKPPPNMTKSKVYRDKSIDQILLMDNVKPMSINSIDKYLTRFSGMFTWAFNEGFIQTNIAINDSIGANSNVSRSPFTESDLQSIFLPESVLSFTHAYQFWVPLIALYSGTRLNEICQLHLSDIQKINDTDVFVIKPTKKIKALKILLATELSPFTRRFLT